MIRMLFVLVAAAGVALTPAPAMAGKWNKKLSIGDAAPAFSGLETTDGKSVSLADLKDKDVVVVAFTCNHCPVAVAYEDRLIKFAKEHAKADSKVALVAISVNNMEADKLPKMKERAKEKGFNFQYAHDPSQKSAQDYGATKTPEFIVINKDRKIAYLGAFDDNMKEEKVTKHYVVDAVKALLKGETPATQETAAQGCGIKFDSK